MGVQIQGDTGNVLATKGTYSGNLTVGGVLTYEDVTNVDSVGLVTARSGIEIGARPGVAASISVDGNMIISGISTFNGDVKFDGATAGRDITFDRSDNQLEFEDNAKAAFGTGGADMQIYSDGYNPIINTGTNTLRIVADNIHLEAGDFGDEFLRCTHDGGVALYYDNSLKFTTSSSGISVTGAAAITGAATLGNGSGLNFGDTSARIIGESGSSGLLRFDTNGGEKLRINSSGKVLIGDDTAENIIGLNANVQTFGTDASTSSVAIRRGSNDAQAAFLVMSKSRNASVGSRTIVNNGDEIGNIFFAADDGTDLVSNTAAIKSQVDGAPGANDTPGNLSFWTTPDGSNTATQKVTISNAGLMTATKQYFLLVDLSSDISGYNATGTTHVLFNRIQQENKDASLASCFNTSNGLFTAPVAGLYFLEAAVYSTNASFGQSWFVVSGARKSYTDEVMTGGSGFTHNHTILRLAANETVGYLAYSNTGSSVNIRSNANHTYMKIALIC